MASEHNLTEDEVWAFAQAWFKEDKRVEKHETANVKLISKLLLKEDLNRLTINNFVTYER